eukprot:7364036-Lingulodinium_polyedra.AAC.1
MRAPVMGWSWAVSLAHWATEDMLAASVTCLSAEARLTYQVALPQFWEGRSVLHWEFIDDVGGL